MMLRREGKTGASRMGLTCALGDNNGDAGPLVFALSGVLRFPLLPAFGMGGLFGSNDVPSLRDGLRIDGEDFVETADDESCKYETCRSDEEEGEGCFELDAELDVLIFFGVRYGARRVLSLIEGGMDDSNEFDGLKEGDEAGESNAIDG